MISLYLYIMKIPLNVLLLVKGIHYDNKYNFMPTYCFGEITKLKAIYFLLIRKGIFLTFSRPLHEHDDILPIIL